MASSFSENTVFKQSIVETLIASLSLNTDDRLRAEDQIKILETSDDFGVSLTEIIIEPSAPQEIRQFASVLLKQYVDSHWSALSEEKFKPPEVPAQAKSFIRANLPNGLKDESSKIRTSVAYAMSRIASYDWPEAWPELFTLLIEALHSMNANVIHGAMRVFTEFAGEVTDIQIPHIAPIVLPEMLKLFTAPEIYGMRTSGRAVNIFATLAGLIGLMKGFFKGIDKQHLFPFLPDFLNACAKHLALPDSDCGLKIEILKALEILVKNFPKTLSKYIPDILPPVWGIFTQSVDYYINTTVNCIDQSADIVDEDGEILSFENLVFSVFQFIQALVETPKFKKTVEQYLEEILYYTMVYMQITDEQIELWSHDPNQFVEDEDEETLSFSVRISAQEIILTLAERFNSATQKLCNAVARLKQKGEELKQQGDTHWWKYHEVCLLSLGYIQPSICEKLESQEINAEFKVFLTEFLLASCSTTVSPFLLGQSFWASSRYASCQSEEALSQFLFGTVRSLQENSNPVLQVFAVKSLFGFCIYLKENNKVQLLHAHLEAIASSLIALATSFTDSVLAITLETLIIVVTVNPEFTSNLVQNSNLLPLTNALIIKYGADHHISPLIEEVIGKLVENPTCFQCVMEKTLPTLIGILEAPADKVPSVLVPPTVDIITVILRSGPKPTHSEFVRQVFPLVVRKTMETDDDAMIQNGGECVRAFVSCSDEVLTWHDGAGQSGLSYIIQVACKLLDPHSSESTALYVGKLVNTLVLKAGNILGDNLEIILRSVLSKLQKSEIFTVTQSLLMVFIQLLRHQIDATLEFLSAVPAPSGKSALHYILSEWCSKQPSFYGKYDLKVSCDALCKLLLHGVLQNDGRFEEIVVIGDEIQGQGIVTRSKAKQGERQYTYVPVAIKLFKLILNELSNQLESENNNEDEEDDDEDEEEEWEDIEENNVSEDIALQKTIESLFSNASDFLGFDDFDEEEEDDPDTINDPINQTELKVYLTEFVTEFSRQSCFSNFVPLLNDAEKICLNKIGITS